MPPSTSDARGGGSRRSHRHRDWRPCRVPRPGGSPRRAAGWLARAAVGHGGPLAGRSAPAGAWEARGPRPRPGARRHVLVVLGRGARGIPRAPEDRRNRQARPPRGPGRPEARLRPIAQPRARPRGQLRQFPAPRRDPRRRAARPARRARPPGSRRHRWQRPLRRPPRDRPRPLARARRRARRTPPAPPGGSRCPGRSPPARRCRWGSRGGGRGLLGTGAATG